MWSKLVSLVAVAILVFSAAGRAQPTSSSVFTPEQRVEIVSIIRSALKSDPSILSDAVVSLQEQESERGAAAGSQAVAANRKAIYAAGDHVAGNIEGNVTLVEFFDVRCPYCRHMLPALDQLVRDDGSVRLILKDLPILGPASTLGAQALLAAEAQGGFMKMQAALMRDGVTVDEPAVEQAALEIGLDVVRLKHDMADPSITSRIADNLALARKLDIDGTPVIVAGDQILPGAMSIIDLKKTVAALRR